MNTPIAGPVSPAIEYAVLETVAYSDVFDFPLTCSEIRRWLPIAASPREVESAVETLLGDRLSDQFPYATLRARESIVAVRERRRISSQALRKRANFYGKAIARLPFVRMVALTGALAVDNADADDDLDYLIVTTSGRVWLTRAMTMLVVRFAAFRGVTLCPNYLLAEDALALDARDFYTARELLQMAPIAGLPTYNRMLAANPWWQEYLPNIDTRPALSRPESPSLFRRTVEAVLGLRPFDRLEAWLLAHKGGELRRGAGPEAIFNASMCKGHFEGWQQRIGELVEQRVQALRQVRS